MTLRGQQVRLCHDFTFNQNIIYTKHCSVSHTGTVKLKMKTIEKLQKKKKQSPHLVDIKIKMHNNKI